MLNDIKAMINFCLDEASKQNKATKRQMYIDIARSLVELDTYKTTSRCCTSIGGYAINGGNTNITPLKMNDDITTKYYTSCDNSVYCTSEERNGN